MLFTTLAPTQHHHNAVMIVILVMQTRRLFATIIALTQHYHNAVTIVILVMQDNSTDTGLSQRCVHRNSSHANQISNERWMNGLLYLPRTNRAHEYTETRTTFASPLIDHKTGPSPRRLYVCHVLAAPTCDTIVIQCGGALQHYALTVAALQRKNVAMTWPRVLPHKNGTSTPFSDARGRIGIARRCGRQGGPEVRVHVAALCGRESG